MNKLVFVSQKRKQKTNQNKTKQNKTHTQKKRKYFCDNVRVVHVNLNSKVTLEHNFIVIINFFRASNLRSLPTSLRR